MNLYLSRQNDLRKNARRIALIDLPRIQTARQLAAWMKRNARFGYANLVAEVVRFYDAPAPTHHEVVDFNAQVKGMGMRPGPAPDALAAIAARRRERGPVVNVLNKLKKAEAKKAEKAAQAKRKQVKAKAKSKAKK